MGKSGISFIESHITTVRHGDTFERTCKYCPATRKSQQLQAPRWAVHFIECEACPRAVKVEAYRRYPASKEVKAAAIEANILCETTGSMFDNNAQDVALSMVSLSAPRVSSVASTNKKERSPAPKKQKTLMEVYDQKCHPVKAARIREKITAFLIEAGISISAVETPAFGELLRELNPDFAPLMVPARQLLRQDLVRYHDKIQETIQLAITRQPEKYMTLGIDSFVNENGDQVYIFTAAKGDKVLFVDCVYMTKEWQSEQEIARIILAQLRAVADGQPVEAVFGGFVFDPTKVDPGAGKVVQEEFSKLMVSGCSTHAADLLVEEFAKIRVIRETVEDGFFVAKFVKEHDRVKVLYKNHLINLGKGTPQNPTAQMRVAYCNHTLKHVLGESCCNIKIMRSLMSDPAWDEVVSTIDQEEVSKFVRLIKGAESHSFMKRIDAVQMLTSTVAVFIAHIERRSVRGSWIIPLFEAFKKDIWYWQNEPSVSLILGVEACEAVLATFSSRYRGDEDSGVKTIYNQELLLSMILDPYTSVPRNDLTAIEPNWLKDCRSVLERYYGSGTAEAHVAEFELMGLVDAVTEGRGIFGESAIRLQTMIRQGEQEESHGLYHVKRIVKQQLAMLRGTPVTIWRTSFAMEYPRLAEIMERLLPLTIQSGDVERCCQLNKLIQAKMWNSLPKASFKMLVGCHVNSRLQRLMASSVKGSPDLAEDGMDIAPINEGFLSERAIDLLDEDSGEE
ncbi:hypothetical protein FisN_16Lh060 [Fistulifera solaris]|uniref:DUF659 domain-containing protein n=1 Tax=Fistulifera solaris TaxID=1519565 RepID=A0A1Z5KJF8_FISSO|nr:hypothetical protein FisN_16Lh060 [Fistulifera solaris]|eukprot:GAX26232.1 hypothetical protein FisN_16Lh060 [Fistulifera solaris]